MPETNEQRYIREGRYTRPTNHDHCDPPHYEATCYLHDLPVDHTTHPATCDANRVATAGECETSIVCLGGSCHCATRTFTWWTYTDDGAAVATINRS
jgi:hypothetical protein